MQLLAKLGGGELHKDGTPGKITPQRGLSHLLEMLVTQAVLSQYETTHHRLPPQIAAFLHKWGPANQLGMDLSLDTVQINPSLIY